MAVCLLVMPQAYATRHVAVVSVPGPLVAFRQRLAGRFACAEAAVRRVLIRGREAVPVGGIPIGVAGEGTKTVVCEEVSI